MRKIDNVEIKIRGFHRDLDEFDSSKNVVFTKDGHVETRPGMTEIITPTE